MRMCIRPCDIPIRTTLTFTTAMITLLLTLSEHSGISNSIGAGSAEALNSLSN